MPRRKRSRYGEYCAYIKGRCYGSVNIPLGNGKYKRVRKRVANEIEARQWALDQLDKLHLSNYAAKTTFNELAEWYEKEYLVPPVYQKGKRLYGLRTYAQQRGVLERLVRYFTGYKLNTIDVDVLRRFKRERLKKVTITTVNRDFALLRTMFRKAVTRKWMRENPFAHGEHLIESSLESHRDIFMSDRVAYRLLARSRKSEQPLLFYLILVAMNTGARPSELMPYNAVEGDGVAREPLIWANITQYDFKAIKLVSYKSRVRLERIVPTTEYLEKHLVELHEKLKPKDTDMLFPMASIKKAWGTLQRSCRVKGYVLRDFRRYYNTRLLSRGFDEVSRMLILGHKEVTTNLRYAAISEEFVRVFREKMRPN